MLGGIAHEQCFCRIIDKIIAYMPSREKLIWNRWTTVGIGKSAERCRIDNDSVRFYYITGKIVVCKIAIVLATAYRFRCHTQRDECVSHRFGSPSGAEHQSFAG